MYRLDVDYFKILRTPTFMLIGVYEIFTSCPRKYSQSEYRKAIAYSMV